MTAALPEMPDDRLGVIGTRQLVAVQTLDIARLTAHPVVIIPGTFIAVTGKGPVDSNESGKTSFLSAVALLLGDPEWRITGTGAASVEALLFEPITAGAPLGVNAATEGYIVGVFADDADISGTAYTTWMKISAGRPHVQVRHASGLHLARGTTDRELHEHAPEIYRALGGEPLGSTEYAQVLFGRSPRVLAYVASRGRVRSRPSLLKLDAGTFSPAQIGDALITLAGRAALFDRDQRDRQDLAAKQDELAAHIKRDAEHTAREDEILRHVEARNRLRRQADHVTDLWLKHRARAVLDAYAKAESAAFLLANARTDHDALAEELGRHRTQRDSLRNVSALQQAVRDRARELTGQDAALTAAIGTEAVLRNDLTNLEQELDECRQAAAGYDLDHDGPTQEAVRTRDNLASDLADATASRDITEATAHGLEEELMQAEEGQVGLAGLVIRTLETAITPVTAVSLAEATRLAPDTRPLWEARLAPWRDAVCIGDADLANALVALAHMPGTILITPGTPAPATAASDDPGMPLPDGVLSAPQDALQFLNSLASHPATLIPVPHATDTHTGVHVTGGFEAPVIGGEDIRDYLGRQHRRATERLASLNQQVETIGLQLERAAITADRAAAAERAAALRREVADLSLALASHRNTVVPPLRTGRDDAWTAHRQAKAILDTRELAISQLNDSIRSGEHRMGEKLADIERLTRDSRPDDAALAAWGRGKQAAYAALGWPFDDDVPGTPDRIRSEAPVPRAAGVTGPAIEGRSAATLADGAMSQLAGALIAFESYAEGTGGLPPELRSQANDYLKTQEPGVGRDMGGTSLESTMAALQAWLDDESDRDRAAPEQVAQAKTTRAETTDYVTSEARNLREALGETQQAITERAVGALSLISTELDSLNRSADGLGAQLDCDVIPPSAPDQQWICRVTPRWRRNPGGPMLAYDNVTNTAQEKLFSIHLVLAALLAAPHPRGRVLILDELADSLGAEHRREVLDAIAAVAKTHGITVLATCQDSILTEARPYCREILYFHYPSKSEALNRPTRIFGVDPDGTRVALTAEALTETRGPN
jgi:chromosome segregation protein